MRYEDAKKVKKIKLNSPPKGQELAYAELHEDLALPPEERIRGDRDFVELCYMEEDDRFAELSPEVEEEELMDKKPPANKPKKSKRKKSTNREEEEDGATEKKKAKRKPGRPRKNQPKDEEADQPLRVPADEREYKMCEMSYGPQVDSWKQAVEDEATDEVLSSMDNFMGVLGQCSLLFIEKRNLQDLVDQTDKFLSTKGSKSAISAFNKFQKKFQERLQSLQNGNEEPEVEEEPDPPMSDDDDYDAGNDVSAEFSEDEDEYKPTARQGKNTRTRHEKKVVPKKKKIKAKVARTTNRRNATKKWISINTKFFEDWQSRVDARNADDLKFILQCAVTLAHAGKVKAEFLKGNREKLQKLVKLSRVILKDNSDDGSILKEVKSSFSAVFAAGQGKEKAEERDSAPSTLTTADVPSVSVPSASVSEEKPIDCNKKLLESRKSDTLTALQPSEESAELQARKNQRKSRSFMSLSSILKPQTSENQEVETSKGDAASTGKGVAKWLSSPSSLTRQKEDPRALGTDFIEQMVQGCLPQDLNHQSTAIEFESALWQLASSLTGNIPPSQQDYFRLVHLFIAGCCSTEGSKACIAQLLEAEFESPLDFVQHAVALK